ncbi:regulatory LuxR family protein [Saccharothrix variisporea]|uniref:Regulatory LuxR family protein n=1 Tax=Saccharothrix variisporea TaxID=543527 RepID=A0A495X1R1_9PSEU|nr:LuxR family transcriptional regulator [Saccharothrix variisporea]RKT67797.1 regulatory LuxR family protein [Saccharothrix variisporea]
MGLIGRDVERKRLAEVLDGIAERGGALVVRGEVGVGKSALVADATEACRVLAAVGTEAEAHLPFAGLHRLLHPVRRGLEALPGPQRAALATALGMAEGPEPNPYLVGLATLSLLAEEAATRPLVVVADDAHWLDRSSAEVLAFVARRLESEPVVLLATVRDDTPSPFDDLPALTLDPLGDDAAAELLTATAPDLAPDERARLLRVAAGNPLALTELPTHPAQPRLERAFLDRVAALPPATAACLLAAAVNDGDSVDEARSAAATLVGPVDVTAFAPAVRARLVEVAHGAVRFRHPLMRSAIAGSADTRPVHRALAEVLHDQPDRQVWHRAAATDGPDEDVAADLAHAADRARRRGAVHTAIEALERAARLGTTDLRGPRLLLAAELAVEAGRRDVVDRLVAEAGRLPLGHRARATATWLVSAFDDGIADGSGAFALAALAESVADVEDHDLATRILWGAGMRCFWVEPGPDARAALLAVADRLLPDPLDPRAVAISAYLAPTTRVEAVLSGLTALSGETDPQRARFLGSAALQVGAFDLAARFSGFAVPGLRAQGRLGLVTRALAVQAWSRVRLGDIAGARPAAVEAERLAVETDQPYLVGFARAVQAEIAALRGEVRQANALAGEAERSGLAAAARPVLATARRARALAASAEGRHGDAFTDLRRMADPADPAHQVALHRYVLPEMADAAVRCDRAEELAELLAGMEPTASPAFRFGLDYANAVLKPSDEAFTRALETTWPLDRARAELALGEWLRRRRRVVEARDRLRAARDAFDALGTPLWGDRARRELRTAGETSPNRAPNARDLLTPHELGIAQLAAEGLTNREIGQRLYLSHRTVSTHLHRIFPKLGVSSRTELGDVLE